MENSYIELFDRQLGDECPTVEVFFSHLLTSVKSGELATGLTIGCGPTVHWPIAVQRYLLMRGSRL
jgi:hypothetical protein